jgi:predicted transcriptional regulator
MTFAQVIKKHRKELKITQKELCKALDIKHRRYIGLERGKVAPTKQEMIDILNFMLDFGKDD